MGQSVGAVFALRCAREEGLRDIFDGTTVCLVSPWVPLAAPGNLHTRPLVEKEACVCLHDSPVAVAGPDARVRPVSISPLFLF